MRSVLDTLCSMAEETWPRTKCAILLYDPRSKRLHHGAAPSLPDRLHRKSDVGVLARCASSARRMVVPNLADDVSWGSCEELLDDLGVRTAWIEPILSSDRELLGVAVLYGDEPRELSTVEGEFLEHLAETAGLTISSYRTQRAAEEGERFRFALIDAASDAILTIAADGRVAHANRAAEALFGVMAKRFTGRPVSELFSEGDVMLGPPRPSVAEAVHRSGTTFPVEVVPIEVNFGTGRDVLLVRKQPGSEEQCARDLRLAEGRYRRLFDLAPDLYATVSLRGQVTDLNETGLEMLGYTRPEVLGGNIVRWLNEETRKSLPAWTSALESSRQLVNEPCTLIRKDGTALRTSLNARMGRDSDGHAEVCIALRDISRRMALQESLEESERYEMTGRLAAGIAHDVNNPLQAILLHMSIVEDGLGPDFAEQESWRLVHAGVERIRQVVGSLMDLHRVGRSRVDSVDLNELVDEAAGLLATQLQVNGIRLDLSCSDSLPRLSAVPQHVYQIAVDLMMNGIGAMPEGGVLSVSTRLQSGDVVLEVRDTGNGFEPAELEAIDDPFRSGPERVGGLGLFVTRRLVEDQGGTMEIDSDPGKGCCVRVVLPQRVPRSHEAASDHSPPPVIC